MNYIRPNLVKFLEEIEYRIGFNPAVFSPGKWTALNRYGSGFSFEKFDKLSSHPDFRLIDIFVTARSFFAAEPVIRLFKQTASIDVIMLADFSKSMLFGFEEPKIWQIAKLAVLFGYTAYRYGDKFGFIAFDEKVIERFYYPPYKSKSAGLEIGENSLDFRSFSGSAKGILDSILYLPNRKSLVVLVSDFYWEPEFLKKSLEFLSSHEVLPIMLRQRRGRRWPQGLHGFMVLKDAEKNHEEAVFLSKRSIRKFNQQAQKNEAEIKRIFQSFDLNLLILENIKLEEILKEMEV